MASLADVFRVLEEMREEGVVGDCAIGDATTVLFYSEPTRTYDVDVFALLPSMDQPGLIALAPVYRWAKSRGFTVDAEHLLIHSVPVQILPAYNARSSSRRFRRHACTTIKECHFAAVLDAHGISVEIPDEA